MPPFKGKFLRSLPNRRDGSTSEEKLREPKTLGAKRGLLATKERREHEEEKWIFSLGGVAHNHL
jgi:hypothetical protein